MLACAVQDGDLAFNSGIRCPVCPHRGGQALSYSNMHNRCCARRSATPGSRNVGTAEDPERDCRGVAFHAFRKACGSLLFARGKTLKQVQGWLRHSSISSDNAGQPQAAANAGADS